MEHHESLWMATASAQEFAPLSGDTTADVAVMGGGIAGILASWQLEKEGFTVAVLEANRVCAGVTGYTTAKVTSGHALTYTKLFANAGPNHAQAYADANQWGVEWIASNASALDIQCDLERRPMLIY